jgi:hypothetical protein
MDLFIFAGSALAVNSAAKADPAVTPFYSG